MKPAAEVDLHLHTNYSDGVYSPSDLVRLAARAGMKAIAIADHDHLGGIDEAMEAAEKLGVELLPAVELSSQWGGYMDIHLLGYGFDHRHPELLARLEDFRTYRQGRNEQVVARVNERLLQEGRDPIDFAQVLALAEGALGRPHIAQILVASGHARHSEDAFQRYLVPCNVPKKYFPMDEAIALLHRAGGVAVLAHPLYITSDRKRFEALLDEFTTMGLDGVEALCSGFTKDDRDYYLTQARRRGLLVTGGSDFHGIEQSGIAIGTGFGNLAVGYSCVEEILSALGRLRVKQTA